MAREEGGHEFADWLPAWARNQTPITSARNVENGEGSSGNFVHSDAVPTSQDSATRESSQHGAPAPHPPPSPPPAPGAGEPIIINADPTDRTVKRELRGIHIFMITISGTLGVGLYVRSGSMLRIAGPGGVIIAFILLGSLAWGVMQCIAEMLCIWPITGALIEFVQAFVDEELGIVVGMAYWFTYSISFAALIAGTAGEADFWGPSKPIDGVLLFSLVPLILAVLNGFGVKLYGFLELVGGTFKLFFVATIIVIMIAIFFGAGSQGPTYFHYWKHDFIRYDTEAAPSWTVAFFISLSLAAFAFVGVEITAATALEAQARRSGNGQNSANGSLKFSATKTSFIAAMIYVAAGALVSVVLKWDDPNLPRLSWLSSPKNSVITSNSAFVIAAEKSAIQGLASVFTVFLMLTALSAANTNIYVASRTLFGLTRGLEVDSKSKWYIKVLAYFGRTNDRRVPMRALVVSLFFSWIPFFYLSQHNGPGTSIAGLLEVLAEMGSVSCVMVWFCECWAFIRFFRCLKRHKIELEEREIPSVRRSFRGQGADYAFRSHGQPFTAYASLFGCFFILTVANGATMWVGFRPIPFCSACLAPICFVGLWLGLKFYRGSPIRMTDLGNIEEVIRKFERLNQIRDASTEFDPQERPRSWRNLWGLL